MAVDDSINNAADDAKAQIAQLRRQVEQLMSERVTPVLADAAGRAQDAAQRARDFTSEQAEMITERVREQPLLAVLIAAGVGFLIGRIAR
ncbi:MAG TPA: hypothetical protein VME92_02705 [Acetobacteraceae bacterium]|nr:hypothetical protein [Acetobacteraceae bacterium]